MIIIRNSKNIVRYCGKYREEGVCGEKKMEERGSIRKGLIMLIYVKVSLCFFVRGLVVVMVFVFSKEGGRIC